MKIRVDDDAAIMDDPNIEYLIDKFATTETVAVFHGQSGCGKSFIVLSAAFAIASGRPWNGHTVKQGPVLYIAAEGHSGMKPRTRAWKQRHAVADRDVVGVHFVRMPLDPLNVDHMSSLHAVIQHIKPILIIVDTLSACLAIGSGDENDSGDASKALAQWYLIMRLTKATVWLIHHQGHEARGRARGSSVWRCNVDAEYAVKYERNRVIRIECKKQKDVPPSGPEFGRLYPILFDDAEPSCTFIQVEGDDKPSEEKPKIPPSCLHALRKLVDITGDPSAEDILNERIIGPCSLGYTDWCDASGITKNTFSKVRKELVDSGYVLRLPDGRYKPATEGVALLAMYDDDDDNNDEEEGDDD